MITTRSTSVNCLFPSDQPQREIQHFSKNQCTCILRFSHHSMLFSPAEPVQLSAAQIGCPKSGDDQRQRLACCPKLKHLYDDGQEWNGHGLLSASAAQLRCIYEKAAAKAYMQRSYTKTNIQTLSTYLFFSC